MRRWQEQKPKGVVKETAIKMYSKSVYSKGLLTYVKHTQPSKFHTERKARGGNMSIYHKSFPSNILDLSPLKLICYLEVNLDPQVI